MCGRSYNLINQQYKKNKLREHFSKGTSVADEYSLKLLERLLCLDPKKRISAIDAIAVRSFLASLPISFLLFTSTLVGVGEGSLDFFPSPLLLFTSAWVEWVRVGFHQNVVSLSSQYQ
jgi:hypothetical protein